MGDANHMPKSLHELKRLAPRDAQPWWEQFNQGLEERGYQPFVVGSFVGRPPSGEPRGEDVACVPLDGARPMVNVPLMSPRSRAVMQTKLNRWRLCEAINWQCAGDQPQPNAHSEIQHFVRRTENRVDTMNHCLPALDIFDLPALDGSTVTFAVFPLLNFDTELEFNSVRDALVCAIQIAEGIHFLHKHGIAHRDVRTPNIVDNRNGLRTKPLPLSSRYYIIDMEDASREPLVEGPPYSDYSEEYIAKEVGAGHPHDPKVADIWQLGKLLKGIFVHTGCIPPPAEALALCETMMQDNPSLRPNAMEVLLALHDIYDSLGPEYLSKVAL